MMKITKDDKKDFIAKRRVTQEKETEWSIYSKG